MPNACICHTELVAFGYEDCDYCEAVDPNHPEVCDFCGHYLASNGSCNHCEAVEFDDDDPTDLSVLSEDCLYDNYSSDSC